MQIFDKFKAWWGGVTNVLTTPIVGNGGTLWDTTPETLRPILNISEAELKRQRLVVRARKMHEGLHDTVLPPRLCRLLGEHSATHFCHRANYLAKVNRGIAKREVIEGFTSSAADEAQKEKQIAFALSVWNGSRMKSKRADLMLMKDRDGEAFLLIDSDLENDRPRWIPHQTYTDPAIGGDGEGMALYYPNGDTNQKPLYGVKRWAEQIRLSSGSTRAQNRITVWFDDHIERYAQGDANGNGGWQLLPLALPDGAELPALEWNTDSGDESGEPLGIPITHLKTPDLRPAALEAIPPQMALNKTYTDMLAAGDMDANRLLIFLGFKPPDDVCIEPGTVIHTTEKDASVVEVKPGDSTRFIQLIDKNIAIMADVTETPLSELYSTGQHKAEGAQQENKEDYYAKIRNYQETCEIAFEDALKISRRRHNVFHVSAAAPELDETPDFGVVWQPLSTRSTADKATEADAMIASGFPLETVWADAWGKTPKEIAEMQKMKAAADLAANAKPAS